MFVAVQPYNTYSAVLQPKTLVFDTDDGTVEYAITKDLYGLRVKNIEWRDRRLGYTSLQYIAEGCCITGKSFEFIPHEYLRYKHLRFQRDSYQFISCNDIPFSYSSMKVVDVVYLFSFGSFVVMRVYNRDNGSWFSFVFSETGEMQCVWNPEFIFCKGDKGLAVKIDTLSEV